MPCNHESQRKNLWWCGDWIAFERGGHVLANSFSHSCAVLWACADGRHVKAIVWTLGHGKHNPIIVAWSCTCVSDTWLVVWTKHVWLSAQSRKHLLQQALPSLAEVRKSESGLHAHPPDFGELFRVIAAQSSIRPRRSVMCSEVENGRVAAIGVLEHVDVFEQTQLVWVDASLFLHFAQSILYWCFVPLTFSFRKAPMPLLSANHSTAHLAPVDAWLGNASSTSFARRSGKALDDDHTRAREVFVHRVCDTPRSPMNLARISLDGYSPPLWPSWLNAEQREAGRRDSVVSLSCRSQENTVTEALVESDCSCPPNVHTL